MHSLFLAAAGQNWNPFAQFGVTSWEPFVANLLAFLAAVVILRVFAFKPIQKMIEERRKRIAEGEEMHARSQQELSEVKQQGEHIISEAREEGRKSIEWAKQSAEKLLDDKAADATRTAHDIIDKSRKAAALEAQQEQEALRTEFSRLVAMATAQVAGKVLTEEDHRRINEEAIKNL